MIFFVHIACEKGMRSNLEQNLAKNYLSDKA
jgi:hypothetical protein